MFRKALESLDVGIKIKGNNNNNLCYTDDTMVIVSSQQELQLLKDLIMEQRVFQSSDEQCQDKANGILKSLLTIHLENKLRDS